MAKSKKGQITVKLLKSPIGSDKERKATLRGLGLNKINKTVTLEDSSSVRGMINQVIHMVEVVL